jgi:hypothetical protein
MTFAAFLRQYEATPPDNLDGYFPFHFEGMRREERDRARTMLLDRALSGHTIELDGLRLIGDAQTIAALQDAEAGTAQYGADFSITLREVLAVLMANTRPLDGLFAWIDGDDANVAERAAETLARHLLPRDFLEPLTARLCDGDHEAIISSLISAWWSAGRSEIMNMHVFQRELPFIRRLSATPPLARRSLLEEKAGAPGLGSR